MQNGFGYKICKTGLTRDSKKSESQDRYYIIARDEHRLGLERTGSELRPILAGPGLDRTAICLKYGGSGLNRTDKIFLVLMSLF